MHPVTDPVVFRSLINQVHGSDHGNTVGQDHEQKQMAESLQTLGRRLGEDEQKVARETGNGIL